MFLDGACSIFTLAKLHDKWSLMKQYSLFSIFLFVPVHVPTRYERHIDEHYLQIIFFNKESDKVAEKEFWKWYDFFILNMHVPNQCWSGWFNIYQQRLLTNIFYIQPGHNLICLHNSDRYFVVFYNHFSNSLNFLYNMLLWKNHWLQHKFGNYH